jgi:hypothetical protein
LAWIQRLVLCLGICCLFSADSLADETYLDKEKAANAASEKLDEARMVELFKLEREALDFQQQTARKNREIELLQRKYEDLRKQIETLRLGTETETNDSSKSIRRPSKRGKNVDPVNSETVTSGAENDPQNPVAAASTEEFDGAYLDRKVHVLLYANTEDGQSRGIGPGAKRNQAMLESLFRFQFRGVLKKLVARDEFTSDTIRRDIAGLSVAKTDAVLVYISTHGAFVDGEHQMSASGSTMVSIRRPVLVESLRSKAGQRDNLHVLITDSCGSILGRPPRAPGQEAPDQPSHELFRLMMTTAGEVNVNAAIPGRVALYFTETTARGGGLFTKAFVFTSVYGSRSRSTGTADDWIPFLKDVSELSQSASSTAPFQPPACWFDRNGTPKSL